MMSYEASALSKRASQPAHLFGGLCATCEHAQNCAFAEKQTSPVLFCEEFAVSSLLEPQHEAENPQPVRAKDAALYTGLCINCNHAATCVYPQAGAGGFFCEEYE